MQRTGTGPARTGRVYPDGLYRLARRGADGGGFRRGGKAVNPALTYLCDPVVGPGLYVPEAIAGVMRAVAADDRHRNTEPFRTKLVDRAKTRDDLGPGSDTTGFALCARGSVDHQRPRA